MICNLEDDASKRVKCNL